MGSQGTKGWKTWESRGNKPKPSWQRGRKEAGLFLKCTRSKLAAILKSLTKSLNACFSKQQLAQIETDLKSRTAAYNTLKTNLENLEKKSM